MSSMSDPSPKRILGLSAAVFAGLIAMIVVLTFIGLGWRYIIAGPSGAVGAKEQQQNANTRVQKQELFEQLAADYDGYLAKIRIAKNALAAASTDIDKELRQTELVGVQQTCVDTAQQFNAESNKYTAHVWKSAGLPATLDQEACTA